MPLSKRVARFNLKVTNPIQKPFARFAPGWAVITHVGRRSGRVYEIPVNIYRTADGYAISLMYGADSQWVKNVMAAGALDIQTRGRRHHLTEPEIVHDPTRSYVPKPVRTVLRRVRVEDFMVMKEALK